jgi:hypothetical protein
MIEEMRGGGEAPVEEPAPVPLEEEPAPVPLEEEEETEVMMDAEGPDPEEEEVESVKVAKDETARSTADERIGTLDKDDDAALAVLKALFNDVKKSTRINDKTTRFFQQYNRILKSLHQRLSVEKATNIKLQRRLDEHEETLNGILEGIGVTKNLFPAEPTKVTKSSLSPDAIAIVEALGQSINKSAAPQYGTAPAPKRIESLRDVMGDLLRK